MTGALPGVSVIIVNYHTPEAIETALEVLTTGGTLDLDVIVVDQEPAPEEQRRHAGWELRFGCRVVPSSTNLGFAGGCNLGAESARHPWLLFLNSDAWMTSQHVERLLRAAVDGGAVAAGPISNRASDVQTMHTWDATKRFRSPGAFLSYLHPVTDEPFSYHRLSGVCLLVRADAFADEGGFERSYGLGYYEDDELTLRLARRGPLLVVPQAFVHHQDGLSWRSTGRHERHLAMDVNRLRFLYRNTTRLLDDPDQTPVVSVIITTYNRPALLRRALASVAAQTYRQVQVIVVDDAGSDVKEVVEAELSSMDLRWTYLRNERNLGKPASINRALEVATGELIAYLDDDDEFLPDHLLAAVNALATDDRLDGVYFASISHKVDPQDRTVHREVVSNEWDVLRLLVVNLLPNCALVHRRSLLDRVGQHEELDVLEDWDFLRRASLVGTFLHVPLVTTTFRVRTDGASRNGLIKRSFASYLGTERQIRVGAPRLAATASPPPAVWDALVQRSLRPPSQTDEGDLENLLQQSGLALETLCRLRPDLFAAHLQADIPEVGSRYAALLCAAGLEQQAAALAGLIGHYQREGNTGAVGRLHGLLSFTLSGTELSGSSDPVETGRRIYQQEGFRGLRELSVLSARRRAAGFSRRLRGADAPRR